MARKGWRLFLVFLSLVLILFLMYLAGVGWGLPFFLKRRLGPGWHLTEYRFHLPATVEIQRVLGPDSSVVLRRLQVRFVPWRVPFRRLQEVQVGYLAVRLEARKSTAGDRSSLQMPRLPVLVQQAAVETLRLQQDPWVLSLQGLRLRTDGEPAEFSYHLDLKSLKLARAGRPLAQQSVTLDGSYNRGRITLRRFYIDGEPLRGHLWLSYGPPLLELRVDSLAWAGLGGLQQLYLRLNTGVPGGELQVARVRWQRQKAGPVTLRFVWNEPRLEILQMEGAVGLLQVAAQGWVVPESRQYSLHIEASGPWQDAQIQGLQANLAGVGLKGSGTLSLASIAWQGRRFQEVQGRVRWQLPDEWQILQLEGVRPAILVQGHGTRDSLALWATVGNLPLAYLSSEVSAGTLAVALQVAGPYRRLRWQGSGRVAHARYRQALDLSFPFRFQGSPAGTRLDILGLRGSLGRQRLVRGKAWIRLGRSEGAFAGAFTLQDSSRLEASGGWTRDGGLTAVLDSLVYRVPRYRTGLVLWASLQAEGPERDVFLHGYDLQGGTFLLTGVQKDTSFIVEAVVDSLALAPFRLPGATNGRANIRLQARGTPRAPRVSLGVYWVGDTLGGLPVDSAHLALRLENRLLMLSSLRLRRADRELRAYGEALMPPDFWVHGNFKPLHDSLSLYLWQWPLTPLLRSQPPGLYLDRLFASGELHVLGTLDRPVFRGNLTLTGPSAVLLASGTELKNLEADLRFQPHVLEIQRFEAQAPPGRVLGQGRTRLRGWNLDTVALDLNLRNFPLQPQPDVDLRVTGPLTVRGVFPRLHIDGSLDLNEGYITTPFGRRSEGGGPAPAPSPVTFRIRLRAPGQLFFINDVVQAELQADLTMEKDQPVGRYLSGNLRVLQGTLTYLDRTFRMEEGQMVFAHDPDFNPEIHFQALTTVQETILIRLLASGTLREPQVQLTSDPVLPLEDIVSLLSFGYTLGQLAPNAATLAYLRTRSVDLAEALVSRELKRRLRLSELEIETGLAGRSPHFTVGFYLSPRVHIRYTHDLQSPSKDVFTLNYLLTRRLWLYVDRDRDSRLGVGLNWRYRF